MSENTRYARVIARRGEAEVAPYLPGNYRVITTRPSAEFEGYTEVIIGGEDNAGWTMDDYVIPRLGSGLLAAREISPEDGRDAELDGTAREIADSITEAARNSGDDPIAWVTGNSCMPPLRSFSAAEQVWQDDSDGENFAYLHELVEAKLADAEVALEAPDYDNALYAVDLRRFEYVDDPGDHETLQQDWQPKCCEQCEGTE